MAATRTNLVLGSNFTQATLVDALKLGMSNAGFSAPIDEYISGSDKVVVYSFVTDSAKTFGTTYLRIRVTTTLSIAAVLYANWNVISHSGSSGSPKAQFSGLVTNNSVNFTALNGGAEFKFLFITQGTTIIPLGIFAPANKPNWWNVDNWTYAFTWASSSLNTVTGTAINPYAQSTYSLLINNSLMINANPQTGTSDVLTGLILLNNSGKGIAGKTSDDLGSACVSGTTRYNTISSDTANHNFLIINPASGGLVIKIT
jgi:hypothetical protein